MFACPTAAPAPPPGPVPGAAPVLLEHESPAAGPRGSAAALQDARDAAGTIAAPVTPEGEQRPVPRQVTPLTPAEEAGEAVDGGMCAGVLLMYSPQVGYDAFPQ
jgi:hypothetical protein